MSLIGQISTVALTSLGTGSKGMEDVSKHFSRMPWRWIWAWLTPRPSIGLTQQLLWLLKAFHNEHVKNDTSREAEFGAETL